MEAIVTRLESIVARIAGGGDDGEGTPVTVSEYDTLFKDSIQPFIDASNKMDDTKQIGTWTETAFKHARNVLEAATQCKKPGDDYMMTFLGPIVTVITDAQNTDNRSPAFNQQKAFAEAIQCLNFLLADGTKSIVIGQLEAADFYLTKTLTVAKDKEDPLKTDMRNWVKTLKTMMTNLGDYCNDFHKTGVMWKFSGGDAKDFKPGEKAAGGGGDVGLEGRLENVCAALEGYAAKLGGGDEDGPICVGAYKEYYKESVQPFIDACKKFPETEKIAKWTEKAMGHLENVIKASTECKKPEGDAFMKFLTPIVEVITEAGNPDRKSSFFNQEQSFFEAIQALNFVCMDGAPKGFIMGQVEAGGFYTNKILVAAKDKEDPEKTNLREWVKTLKGMLEGLANYAHEHFKMGVVWKVKDAIDIADFKP